MSFYTFAQNNSGGSFDFRPPGISHFVIIEANSAVAANAEAEAIGIYFDGAYDGSDCSCCGDRWYRADEYDATEGPEIYGEPVADIDWNGGTIFHWMGSDPEVFVHFANGTIAAYGFATNTAEV